MIVHVVLFRPHPDLSESQRKALTDAFTVALREIPSIRRAHVGERVTLGRAYESLMRTHYSHIAILEFEDVSGLKAYLEHPAHERVGTLFFESFAEALIYDFDLKDPEIGLASLGREAVG